jgi:plastocyanin
MKTTMNTIYTTLALVKIDSWRLVLLLATAVSLIGYPKPASAATFNVTVGVPGGRPPPLGSGFVFAPSSVTIHPGDQVTWTWATSGHSTTSYSPGFVDIGRIWDSGIRNQGATFTHTFNTAGTFYYLCTHGHGGYFPDAGQVIVMSATPTAVATNPATNVTNSSATLNGTVNPNGLITAVHFDYGTTSSYGSSSAIQNYQGNTTQNVTVNLSGLLGGTTYHFRIVASSAAGTTYGADSTFTTLVARAAVADFNGDGHPDFVVQNPGTHQTAIVYLNNNVVISAAFGPTLPALWRLRAVADFNIDSHPDYGLFNSNTGQTALAYLSGPTVIDAALGPTPPGGWELVATADFNGDGYPDYVLYIARTAQTVIAYLNNNVVVGGAFGPTLPAGWALVATADFNGDGHPDYLLYIASTRQTVIAYLNNNVVVGGAFGPALPAGWALVATTDFNGDGHPDYLLYNAETRQTEIWYLNNNVFVSAAFGPTLPAGWSLAGP